MGSSQVLPTPLSGGGSAYTPTVDGLFGDGMDGDAVLAVLTTLSRETYYNNLTITGTGTLKPTGFRIFVRGTLTIQAGGSINDDFNAVTGAVGATGGTGLAARNTLNAQAGGGGGGGTNAVGGAGITSGGNSSLNGAGLAPSGLAGGAGGANLGGAGGACTQPTQGQRWHGTAWPQQGRFNNGGAQLPFNGGSGGGGGGSNNVLCSGGGGGAGAGLVWVAAKTVVNAGRISANAGAGANGAGTSGDAGGGAGGGGGAVLLATTTSAASVGIVQALGGAGGIGFGAGGAGTAGRPGSVQVVVLV